jgi:hypothetical protein
MIPSNLVDSQRFAADAFATGFNADARRPEDHGFVKTPSRPIEVRQD